MISVQKLASETSKLIFKHRYLRKIDCSRHISLKKIYFNKQGRQANEAGRPIRQAGQVNTCACFNFKYFCSGY